MCTCMRVCMYTLLRLQAAEERGATTVSKLKDAWAVELKRQHEAWAAGDKAKREAWLDAKTQEIKDITVKGLESEVGGRCTCT